MSRDKQNIKTTDWLTRGYSEEELSRMKEEAIKEAEAELREKKIEQMAKDLAEIQCNKKGCEDCEFYQFECDDLQHYTKIAELLTVKGYRKASDVAREISDEIEKWRPITKLVIKDIGEFDFDKYSEKFYWVSEAKLAELKKKYTATDTNDGCKDTEEGK